MKTLQILTILLFGLTVLSCNQPQAKQDKLVHADAVSLLTKDSVVTADTTIALLEKSLLMDTIEFQSLDPFIFFKSGNLFNKTEMNAIWVTCPTDSTYSL